MLRHAQRVATHVSTYHYGVVPFTFNSTPPQGRWAGYRILSLTSVDCFVISYLGPGFHHFIILLNRVLYTRLPSIDYTLPN